MNKVYKNPGVISWDELEGKTLKIKIANLPATKDNGFVKSTILTGIGDDYTLYMLAEEKNLDLDAREVFYKGLK